MLKVDDHRRELLTNYFYSMKLSKPFLNMPLWEIRDVLVNDRDTDRFTAEEMLEGLPGFLRRQKGISQNQGTDEWEIRPPLKP